MDEVVFATDLSQRTSAAAGLAARLAARLGADLTVLHVVDSDLPEVIVETHRQQAQAWLESHLPASPRPRRTQVLIRVGDPHEEILAAAGGPGAGLLVLGPHRRRRLFDAFIGTTAERVLRLASVPVLIVHGDGEGEYERVLVGTDLSPASAQALRAASELGLTPAHTTLLHVFRAAAKGKLQQVGEDPAPHLAAERERARGEVQAFLQNHGLPRMDRTLLREGRPVEEILQVVEETSPDLLVLGTRGLSGLRRAVLGSVTEAVIRSVPCDVLAVPPGQAQEES